nr:MAG TPA: hypothetical protein [Caudoviricetes sp.]
MCIRDRTSRREKSFRLFCVITKGANSAELLSYMYIDRRIFRVAFRVAFSPKIVLFNIKI